MKIADAVATATSALGLTRAAGTSTLDTSSDVFKRNAAVFMGKDPVFTRSIVVTRADDAPGTTETPPSEDGEVEDVSIVPESVKVENGEATGFDAIASRGTMRLMYHPVYGRLVWEKLTIGPDTVDLSYLQARGGIPFFDEHRYCRASRLGKCPTLEVTDGEIIARGIKLSRRDDVKGYRQDVADGIADAVSLGYKHVRTTLIEQDGDFPICEVQSILPVELSAACMPADVYAGIIEASIRSAHPNGDVPDAVVTRSATSAGIPATRAANTVENRNMSDTPAAPAAGADTVITRADAPGAPAGVVTATPGFDANAFAQRSAELFVIGRAAGMQDDVITRAIGDLGVTVDGFKAQAYTAMVGRATPGTSAGNDVATRADHTSALTDAIYARMTGGELSGLAREYGGMGIQGMAHATLTRSGLNVARFDANEIYKRTFHVTSDFGNAMAEAARKVLIKIGNDRQLPYTQVAQKQDLPNFQKTRLVDVDNFPALKRLREGGEITHGTVTDGGFDVMLQTLARAMRVSRQAFVNDELGIFRTVNNMLGNRIPEHKNDLVFAALMLEVYRLKAGQPSQVLVEGENLVQGAKNGANPVGAVVELNEDNLEKAYQLMAERRRRDGSYSSVRPTVLLTGSALQAKARKLTSAVLSANTQDVNLYTDLKPVMDVGIRGKSWFLLGDPGSTPALMYGGLESAQGALIEDWQRVPGFDGVECEVKLDAYGAVASSHAIAGSVDTTIPANG